MSKVKLNHHIERSKISQKPHCHTELSQESEISQNTNNRDASLRLCCAQNDNISTSDLRVFLGIWAGIFAMFVVFGILRYDTPKIWALCGAVISIALLATPRVITPFYRAWVWVGEKIGFVISRIILAIIFFGIFTPLGLVFRLFKRDILGLNLAFGDKDKSQSLFQIRETQPTSMKNQF